MYVCIHVGPKRILRVNSTTIVRLSTSIYIYVYIYTYVSKSISLASNPSNPTRMHKCENGTHLTLEWQHRVHRVCSNIRYPLRTPYILHTTFRSKHPPQRASSSFYASIVAFSIPLFPYGHVQSPTAHHHHHHHRGCRHSV